MAKHDPALITVRRSTVVRAGVVVLVLAALGVGTAIGLSVGSKTSPPNNSAATDASTTTPRASTTTSSVATSTTAAPVPAVLSCGPGPTPHVRPATITVGCATKGTTVTDITWSVWDAATGGQGTGTLAVGFQSAPAIVVVFHDVAGIFQDVTVTPSKDRVIDASDDDVDDSRDDPFDHSPDNIDDDNDWWHRPGRGVTARLGVGWGLSASSQSSGGRRFARKAEISEAPEVME